MSLPKKAPSIRMTILCRCWPIFFPDGKVIIAPRDVPSLYEPQTHNEPEHIRYPTEAELKAWGAVKATRQEVCH